jgi:hypothetical protein
MKYMVLIFTKPETAWTGSEADHESLRALRAIEADLTASAELMSAEGLRTPEAGRIVRVREGSTVVTDGPFGEAKEHLAGYFLVDCAGPERATEIAARVAEAVNHPVELREVLLA